VVTPAFNHAEFLEATLRSVLLQDYPNLEYLVIDGGSSDGSRAILERYSEHIDYWVSEPDRGQSDAINKGLRRASGQIVAWLNSDDTYLPGALHAIGRLFRERSDVDWVAGQCVMRRKGTPDETRAPCVDAAISRWLYVSQVLQPACFWRKHLHDAVGYLDESLHYTMDRELFIRFRLHGVKPHRLDEPLAAFLFHAGNKSVLAPNGFRRESLGTVMRRYFLRIPPRERLGVLRVVAAAAVSRASRLLSR
jgi:glycosyltransferase involved in cell wall biosynthesis